MISEKSQVSRYLAFIKKLASEEFILCPRAKNLNFVYKWGIDFETIKDIVFSLRVADYVKGPCADDKDLGRGDVWIFGKTVVAGEDEVGVYIKLTTSSLESGLKCVCISFHESDFILRYAFGGKNHEKYLLP